MHVSGQRVTGAISTTRDMLFIRHKDLKSWVIEEFKLITMLIKHISKFIHKFREKPICSRIERL